MSHQLYKVNTNETVQVGKWKPVTLTVLSARPKDKFACVPTVLVDQHEADANACSLVKEQPNQHCTIQRSVLEGHVEHMLTWRVAQ